ncbi:hypothetical protein NC651_018014 [Populus alba x Populus x berolinensis]|nr:hypothetical protein NC651_018014 [Populus alba x Populus x berolinensis]
MASGNTKLEEPLLAKLTTNSKLEKAQLLPPVHAGRFPMATVQAVSRILEAGFVHCSLSLELQHFRSSTVCIFPKLVLNLENCWTE